MNSRRCHLKFLLLAIILGTSAWGQSSHSPMSVKSSNSMAKLPDTGQTTDYTATFGEDSDYSINIPSFTKEGDGTVIDNVTGLMWQRTDGGEMTFEKSSVYCDTLTLAGYSDWRLPTGTELFSILNHDRLNPALDTSCFTKTAAEYWWTNELGVDDATRVWVVNAGGGIGPHPKSETISAGGVKRFHVRAVRNVNAPLAISPRYIDNGNGTLTDRVSGLVWQKIQSPATMTWEDALKYSDSLSLAGYTDWRLPNIKELQSLNDAGLSKPSIDKLFFTSAVTGRYWSSTTQFNAATHAWYLDCEYGIVSYDLKTVLLNVFCVRGRGDGAIGAVNDVVIPGGEFQMGDHFGFVDPNHPSDELPLHSVKVNSFSMAVTETSNQQCCDLLNAAFSKGLIEVRGNVVFLTGGSDSLCFLYQFASYCSIGWDGKVFSIVDFRANHPMVGVLWKGAAAFCNWFSVQNGLQECYSLTMWECDFTKNGYRLPTEAEWEYAGRGGHLNPYFNYPTGNTAVVTQANLPGSGDPYETGPYPYTTPVGFYDGTLKQKSAYNWPGSAATYQTSNGANGYGLYDMQGNVWEFVNDWYGQNYYSISPYDNPQGPASGFIMPDGKPYRGMRGGNWYNGDIVNSVDDGHSRVSNRNPSYYRGPQDPNHPWYHVGFRVARNYSSSTGVDESSTVQPQAYQLCQNYPNPFNPTTRIQYVVPQETHVVVSVYNVLGEEVALMVDGLKSPGTYDVVWDGRAAASGIYFCVMSAGSYRSAIKMLLLK